MKVVAISGVSGCGKTSVIKHLSKSLFCPYLLFDDHANQNTYPNDMKKWFKNGADLSEIKTPNLIDKLKTILANGREGFIFIEEPFGRCREPISSLIDHVVLLDMPMEVCLSRVIQRNIMHPSIDSLKSISNYLSMYDDYFREIYIGTTNVVRQSSDLIIKDITSVEIISNSISNWLQSRAN